MWELFRRKWTVKEFWKSIFKITRLHKKALEDCDAFNQDVDSLQDALNDEITQLENKRYEHEGIIEQLKMVLNDLDNWLTKLLN
ncbi:DUF5082 domain-containing protein [Tyzzerella nexilis]|nr:DUF5082 domain-containing protein [[Clostridium] nexile]RHG10411.1 DUF5082 domain-containing protein [[Clostridium] nexile]